MHLITSLLILLVASRLLGKLFKSLGYFAIIGEILAGLILGPTLLSWLSSSPELTGIAEFAVFLLIFEAGLEMDLQDIFSAIRNRAIVCATAAFLTPFAVGSLACYFLFDLSFITSSIVGVCFSITALPLVISFLSNVKLLDSSLGHSIMGAAVLIDITALLFLGVILDMKDSSSFLIATKGFFIKIVQIALFFLLVMWINKFLRAELHHTQRAEALFKKVFSYLGEEAIFSVGLIFVLIFSTLSEFLEFHFIIGAFFGGLLLNKDVFGTNAFKSLSYTLNSLTEHFFTPIFFAFIGLQLSLKEFNHWPLLLGFFVLSYTTKILGGYLGARFNKFTHHDSLITGIALNSKGVLDIVVANLALSQNLISKDIFTILVFLGVSSSVINPFLYKKFCKKKS